MPLPCVTHSRVRVFAGVMLINGVYPIRPGKKACAFYVNNGWCAYKAKCRCEGGRREVHAPRLAAWRAGECCESCAAKHNSRRSPALVCFRYRLSAVLCGRVLSEHGPMSRWPHARRRCGSPGGCGVLCWCAVRVVSAGSTTRPPVSWRQPRLRLRPARQHVQAPSAPCLPKAQTAAAVVEVTRCTSSSRHCRCGTQLGQQSAHQSCSGTDWALRQQLWCCTRPWCGRLHAMAAAGHPD